MTEQPGSKVSTTDGVFSVGGFFMGVVPLLLFVYAIFAGALWLMTNLKNTDLGTAAVVMIPFVLLVVPQIMRYMVASDTHREFKEKFGDLYDEKIRRGEISLSAISVPLYHTPERHEEALRSLSSPTALQE